MAIYYVQQKATVWYEVQVEADTAEQALEIGIESIANDDGYPAESSFQWADAYWLGDSEHCELILNENE